MKLQVNATAIVTKMAMPLKPSLTPVFAIGHAIAVPVEGYWTVVATHKLPI